MILPFLLVTLVLMLASGSSPAASGDVLKLINAFKGMPRADQVTFLQQIQPLPTQSPALPQWYLTLRAQPGAVVVDDLVREYTDEAWRLSPESGFGGTDLIHCASRSPVRILQYTLLKAPAPRAAEQSNGADADADPLKYPRLVGAAYFSEAAEGHQHLCHGGSMCALCDDALGWMGFCADGSVRPWAGYTVQVRRTSLCTYFIYTMKNALSPHRTAPHRTARLSFPGGHHAEEVCPHRLALEGGSVGGAAGRATKDMGIVSLDGCRWDRLLYRERAGAPQTRVRRRRRGQPHSRQESRLVKERAFSYLFHCCTPCITKYTQAP